jgi:hypothetical protein
MKALKELFYLVCGCALAAVAIIVGVKLGWW